MSSEIVKARAVLFDDDQRIVLIERNKPERDTYFVFPGGSREEVDPSLIHTVKREVLEELGVTALVGAELCVFEGEAFYVSEIADGDLGTGEGPEFSADSDYEGEYVIRSLSRDEFTALAQQGVVKPEEVADKVVSEWPQ